MTYPILEHDPAREAFIEPSKIYDRLDVPERCVICFFQEIIEKVVMEHQAVMHIENHWEDGPHPLYEIDYRGERLAFFHPGVGAPLAAALMDEVIAFGCAQFVACGGCGVLRTDTAAGHLIVVSAAVRDEGVSYHYLPPAREVEANPSAMRAIVGVLEERGVPHLVGKTWTTDALYRETEAKIAQRRAEGCLTVEMEAAAMMAVAQFRNVPFAQVLYAGDDLSGAEWDDRGWRSRADVREKLFWLAADAALKL